MFAIKLGAWSTTNHAALDCPTCPGAYWPVVHFAESLPRWTAVGLATTIRSSTLAPPQPHTSLIAPRR